MLEGAYKDRLVIHHMVFDYRNSEDTNQPLSWDLTPNQKHNIRCALDPKDQTCTSVTSEQDITNRSIRTLAKNAVAWFDNPPTGNLSNDICTSTGLGSAD
jgi:hypothetical protein